MASVLSGDCDFATSEGLDIHSLKAARPAEKNPINYQATPGLVWEHIDMNHFPPEGAENGALPFFAKDAIQAAFEGENRIDPQERLPYYYELQRLFIDDLPSLPLFQRLNINAHSVTLCGPDPGPANYESWNVETWYFDPTGACAD